VLLNTTNPLAGFRIESLWAIVIRGGKNPFWVLETSRIAELCGLAFESFIATPCEKEAVEKNRNAKDNVNKAFTVNQVFKLVFNATHTVAMSS
jgi:hypothetical protein